MHVAIIMIEIYSLTVLGSPYVPIPIRGIELPSLRGTEWLWADRLMFAAEEINLTVQTEQTGALIG